MTTYFTPDEPACPETIAYEALLAYACIVGADDPYLEALALSALAAHGVGNDLSNEAMMRGIRTERRGLSLLQSLTWLKEKTV